MAQTFRFIKESNGKVIINRYNGATMDFSYSLLPDKDLRPNQNNVSQISIPIDNNGNVPGSEILNIIWTRIDWANCTPSLSVPGSIWEAINELSENFFFENAVSGGGGGGGDNYQRRHEFTGTYSYMAFAPEDSLESATNWQITRINVALDGSTTKGTATGAWTNRASLIYI